MPEANAGPARRDGEADMTQTDTTRYAIPPDTVESSRRRARRLRGRIVSRMLRRTFEHLIPGRPRPAPALIGPAAQPA
jgi:hypothetical protein